MNARVRALALAMLLVVSAFAPAAAAALPAASASATTAPPDGMVGVPDANINDNVPQHARDKIPITSEDLEGSVMTSDHAQSLEIEVTTAAAAQGKASACGGVVSPDYCEDPELAINLTDDVNHEGREVAIPVSVLEDALGRVPDGVYGRHEDGTRWTADARREGQFIVFEVPHFSTNTVTFSGDVSITGSPAADETKYNYNISDLDSADNFTIDVTGSLNQEWDNESGTGVGPGDSVATNPAGNLDPSGPSANGNPTLSVTADAAINELDNVEHEEDRFVGGYVDDNNNVQYYHSEIGVESPPTQFDSLRVNLTASGGNGGKPDGNATIRVIEERPDGTFAEGTIVKDTWDLSQYGSSPGVVSVQLDQAYEMSDPNSAVTVDFETTSYSGSSAKYYYVGDGNSSSGNDMFRQNHDTIKSGRAADVTLVGSIPSLNVTDGNGNSASYTNLGNGETATAEITLDESATSLNFDHSGGYVDYSLEMEEQTQTVDPTIYVNGNSTGYAGTLSDGSTQSLTTDTAWLQSGPNNVTVSVGDGTLTQDAPTSQVGLDYGHDVADKQSVDYQAEEWSERYNVSKKYASDRTNAEVTIPFQATIYDVRYVEMRVNGGSWNSVSSTYYSLSNTTLTVDIGDVQAGDTVEVRTAGSKVQTNNATIQITDPTVEGNSLDSKISLDTWNSDSYVAVGNDSLIHYASNVSWDSADEHIRVTQSQEHHLRFPNAPGSGGEVRINTIPVRVTPNSGEVVLEVENPSTTEPEFVVRPGGSEGDIVDYTFTAAADGEDYILYSRTNDVVRDSGTANSPITLTDDDSDETLVFLLDDSGSSSSGGSTSGATLGPIGGTSDSSPFDSVSAVLLAYGVVLVALYFVDSRISRPGSGSFTIPVIGTRITLPGSGLLFPVGSVAATVLVLEFIAGGLISRSLSAVIQSTGEQIGPLAGFAAIGLGSWWFYRRFIKGQTVKIVDRGGRR